MVIYLFGHQGPDTDSICSSIVYYNYLKSKNIDCKVVKLDNINNETKFVLEKANTQEPKTHTKFTTKDKIILLDHNEFSQSAKNIENLNVIEVIDHHKFNFKSPKPIKIRTEAIGSTCSIIAKILFENKYKITKNDAFLLISGIISDTLYFRSPTTTNEDKLIVKKLNSIAKINNLENYSIEMFNEKSNLGNISTNDLIKLDYKAFDFKKNKFGIGVMETTNIDFALNKKEEIIEELKKIKKKR